MTPSQTRITRIRMRCQSRAVATLAACLVAFVTALHRGSHLASAFAPSILGSKRARPSLAAPLRRRTTTTTTALRSAAAPSSAGISSSQIEELSRNGYVVIPEFISSDLVKSLRSDVARLRSSKKFQVAKIGQDFTNRLNEEIRVAETCFLGKDKLSDVSDPSRDELYRVLEDLRVDLSGNPTLDVIDPRTGELTRGAPALDESLSELLYAYYPRGGYYRRHRDAIKGSASVLRCYSLLLYLNDGWTEEDGGRLRLHRDSGGDFLPEGEVPNYVDVDPAGGTLVLFRSEQVPHEVLDTNAERSAVVGWYNRPLSTGDVESLASDEDKVRAGMLLVAFALVAGGVASLLMG